jgi:hypothetical protein
MGLTHKEFLRSLPRVVAGLSCQREGSRMLVADPPRQLEILLGPEQQRRLGMLQLPLTEVTLTFVGYTAGERARFLRRFDLAFQRGGG